MNSKKILASVSGLSALALVATCGSAFAFGHHGGHHHGSDMEFGMLAHAAGITGEQIHTAFKSDTALKTDFETLKTAKTAMDACIIAGTCTSGSGGQVASYAAAQSALTQEKLNVWQGLFASAPNKSAAVSLKSQLDALNAQKHQLLHQVFSSAKGSTTRAPSTAQQ